MFTTVKKYRQRDFVTRIHTLKNKKKSYLYKHIYVFTNTKNDSSRIENSHDDDRGITGFFKDGNQYKELHEDIIRNDSIRHTSVQSKTNTKTDSSRIENSRDEIYINNFLCLYVPV